jgi:hypothetical protein
MPRYEVELEIMATAWVDVEAEDAAEAIDAAKEGLRIGDADWWEVQDASVKEYAE